MPTHLEVDGFKNLVDFSVDLGPYTCIVEKNASGKSNVFDAIQFLALLSSHSLTDAAQQVRRAGDERTGDPRDLFTAAERGRFDRMRLAAEMIVPADVEDDLGQEATPTITFLRYEVEIGFEDAASHLQFKHSASRFRNAVIKGRRYGKAFISTDLGQGAAVIRVHGDGGSRGKPRPAAAARARATVLSTITSADDPTALAANRA